ncbi:hypothetical protein [Amycolatopsis sp. NPDC003861]
MKYEVLVIEETRHTVHVDVDDPAKASDAALGVVNLGYFEFGMSTSTMRVVSRRQLDPTGPNVRIAPQSTAKVHAPYLGKPDHPLCSARSRDGWVEQTSDPVTCSSCLNIQSGQGYHGNAPGFHR